MDYNETFETSNEVLTNSEDKIVETAEVVANTGMELATKVAEPAKSAAETSVKLIVDYADDVKEHFSNNSGKTLAEGTALGVVLVAAGYGAYKGVAWCVRKYKHHKFKKEMEQLNAVEGKEKEQDNQNNK